MARRSNRYGVLALAAVLAPGLVAALVPPPLAAAPPPSPSPGKQAAVAAVAAHRGELIHLSDTIWEYAETALREHRSAALLADYAESQGFAVERGVAGLPTGFVAEYGSGRPVIAILGEYDALPGLSQEPVPEKSPRVEGGGGHGCGHNLFGAASMGAAVAVKERIAAGELSGTVRFYGTPAEESVGGKLYMVREGLFDDVDVVLHWHADDENSAVARTTLANRSAKFRFHGVSAHAAGAPEKARSALDGVEAFNYMVNLMREHVPQQTRIHYVITSGGSAPNVVPDFAEVFYYLRHPEAEQVTEIWSRLEQAAKGAASGTGVDVDWEIIHGNHPVLINESLAVMMDEKLRQVGGVEYSEAEEAFAQEIYATLSSPELPLGSQSEIQPYEVTLGYGSTDVGDVSMTVPTVGLRVATWVPGTAAHSWQAVAASGMTIGYKGAQVAAKTLALAAVELYRNNELREAARDEFEQRRGPNFHYEALLGDRAPPLDYRR